MGEPALPHGPDDQHSPTDVREPWWPYLAVVMVVCFAVPGLALGVALLIDALV